MIRSAALGYGVTVSVAFLVTPPAAPEMVTVEVAVTVLVVTVNDAVVAPAGTVTLAGTVATEVLLLLSVTAVPPDGAGALSVTVPVEELPPFTLVGLRASEEIATPAAGVTVSVAVWVTEPNVAEIVTATVAETFFVVTVNEAVAAPAETVTLAGTVAALVLLLERVTTAPADGAGEFSVTVPVEGDPPCTLGGSSASKVRLNGVTVSVAVAVAPA